MQSVLVTGGAGFIGSHLVDFLLGKGYEVTVVDNLSSGRKENVPSAAKFYPIDVRDTHNFLRVAEKVSIIMHLAEFIPNTAQIGPGHVIRYSFNAPLEHFDASVKATLSVLEVARLCDKPVVFFSSAAVYGSHKRRVKESSETRPISLYGLNKLIEENYCKFYEKTYSIKTLILRLFNVYGPRMEKYVIFDILSKLANGNNKPLKLMGTGNETRDFIYVKDVVNATYLLVRRNKFGETYNIGTGTGTKISSLVSRIMDLVGYRADVTFTGTSWPGDIPYLVANNEKLLNSGFRPKYSIEKGLKETIGYYIQRCNETAQH